MKQRGAFEERGTCTEELGWRIKFALGMKLELDLELDLESKAKMRFIMHD